MKTKLFTKNTYLGLLMALVLVFGVQGIADAQTLSVSGDGSGTGVPIVTSKTTTPALSRSFTVAVTKATSSTTLEIASSDSGIATIGTLTASPARGSLATGINVTNAASISFSANWSGSITVPYTVKNYGAYTITVTPANLGTTTAKKIKGYVVRDTSQANSQRTGFTATPDSTQVNARAADITLQVTTGATYTRVKFDIESGDGSLYTTSGTYYVDNKNVKMDGKNFGDAPFSVYTNGSSVATVSYQPNSDTTARIKMEVESSTGIGSKHYVTAFYSPTVTLRRISGNKQFGQANSQTTLAVSRGQLKNPLVVRVLDGSRAVPNQVVRFDVDRSALLRYQLINTYVQTSVANTGHNTNTIYVMTGSQGDAKVYLVPSTSVGTDTVNYEPHNLSANMSTSTAVASTNVTSDPDFTAAATRLISNGANERVDRANSTSTPQINARYGSTNTPLEMSLALGTGNVQVHFQITDGQIYLNPADLDLTQPNWGGELET